MLVIRATVLRESVMVRVVSSTLIGDICLAFFMGVLVAKGVPCLKALAKRLKISESVAELLAYDVRIQTQR